MKKLFADTFFFAALLNPRDSFHLLAREWADRLRNDNCKLVTTGFVLVELGNALASSPARKHFSGLLQTLGSWQTTVLPANQRLLNAGLKLYGDRPDKAWSAVDCISFIVMKQQRIQDALTEDHHFEQAGFRCLLKT